MTSAKGIRSVFAIVLGLFALAASGVEQYQLSGSMIWAAFADAGGSGAPDMPTAAAMPADCPMNGAANRPVGHTHRGHADCPICGAEMAHAAFTLPFVLALVRVSLGRAPSYVPRAAMPHDAAILPPYGSRGPPPVV